MTAGPSPRVCLGCGSGEQERPLLHLSYRHAALAICPQCLPTLIHTPERMAERLGETVTGAPPCHD